MKILIGYDGSDCAEAALDDLGRAGLPHEAEAHILSVAEVWLPPPPPSSYEIVAMAEDAQTPDELRRHYAHDSVAVQEAFALAEKAVARVQTNFPNWDVSADATGGSPGWELVMKADEWKPDLVIVGSHGRTALGRLILGSVSQRVVTEARCSVRVARGRVEEPDNPIRIVVAVDGSAGSQAAVREVAARSWHATSEVQLVVVDDPLMPKLIADLVPALTDEEAESAWAEKILADASALLQASELRVTTAIMKGDPKRELVRAAEDWGADCIFVGSTGFSNRLERFVLGSVSAAVVAHAHCSVEVIRKSTP